MPDAASSSPFWRVLGLLLLRELLLARQAPLALLSPLLFLALAASLFFLVLAPYGNLPEVVYAAVLWVAILLANLTAMERLFGADYDDGCLEQCLLSGQPLYLPVLGKLLAHWLVTTLPLALGASVLALASRLPLPAVGVLFWSLLLGSGVLSSLGALGAALLLSLRRGVLLLYLLVLPLYVPVLLWGMGSVEQALRGEPAGRSLAALAGLLLLTLSLVLPAVCVALHIALED